MKYVAKRNFGAGEVDEHGVKISYHAGQEYKGELVDMLLGSGLIEAVEAEATIAHSEVKKVLEEIQSGDIKIEEIMIDPPADSYSLAEAEEDAPKAKKRKRKDS